MQWDIKQRLLIYFALYAFWLCVLVFITGGLALDTQEWFSSLQGWDVHWYNEIIDKGYSHSQFTSLAFPPGFPYAILVLSKIFSLSFEVTAVLLNILLYFVALVLMVELLSRLYDIRSRATLFLLALSNPTGYFVLIAYSDILFMAMYWGILFLAVLYPYSRRSLIMQAVLLVCIPWVRIAGYSLFGLLVFQRYIVTVLVIPAVLWLYFNHHLTGDMLYFFKVQQRFLMPEGWLADGFIESCRVMLNVPWHSSLRKAMTFLSLGFLPIAYFIALSIAAIWFWRSGQPLIAISMITLIFISHSMPFWRSTLRYDMIINPCLFVPLFCLAQRGGGYAQGIWISTGGLAMFQLIMQWIHVTQFRIGEWGF
jgi:hypothetical protein